MPEIPPNPFALEQPDRPATPNYPSPTGAAVKQLSSLSLPALPTGRAGPAMSQIQRILATNRPAADRLADTLHGVDVRADLVAASRKAGYPADPAAAPASTVKLLGEMYPHRLPATRFENRSSGKAQYEPWTGQTLISDPLPQPGPWYKPKFSPIIPWLEQRAVNSVASNRVGLTRHETEHALQNMYLPPVIAPPGTKPGDASYDALVRQVIEQSNAMEIPASLGDLPYTAQAHKLETGKPLNVPVTVAPGITHDADWMARQAEQHGMFRGHTTTELLATPAGQAYLKRLLAAHAVPQPSLSDRLRNRFSMEKQNQYKEAGSIWRSMLQARPRLGGSFSSSVVNPLQRSFAHVQRYGALPFEPFKGINMAAIQPGAFMPERLAAGRAGNALLPKLQNSGFQFYGGRVKAPGSMAAHGTGITDDLLGLRARPTAMFGGYSQRAIDQLTNQMRSAGVDVSSTKRLVRPGYHGWNIKGQYQGTPLELQVSPRRLQGLSALDHDALYKSHVLDLPPTMQAGLKRLLPIGMNLISPMASPAWRYGRAIAGVGVGAVGGGAGAIKAQNMFSAGHPGINTNSGQTPESYSTPAMLPTVGELPNLAVKQAAHPVLADLKTSQVRERSQELLRQAPDSFAATRQAP